MGSKYSNQAVSGYNANPPSDDGSATASNQVKWSYHKTKIGDPILTLAQNINSALVTALDTSSRTTAVNDTTLTSDHWKMVECTAALTEKLGDATTMGAGYIVTIANRSSASVVTVALATATDSLNGTTNGTITLAPHTQATFRVINAANGYVTESVSSPASTSLLAGYAGSAPAYVTSLPTSVSVGAIAHKLANYSVAQTDNRAVHILDAAITATLPQISTLIGTFSITFVCGATSGTIANIARGGTDTFSIGGSVAATSIPLATTGDSITLVADAASNRWQVVEDNIQGPAINIVYSGSGQTLGGTNVATKLQFNSKAYDYYGCYDATTNYRFTPTIPGWYQISANPYFSGGGTGRVEAMIYKNGVSISAQTGYNNATDINLSATLVTYMNGTTDYIEAWGNGIDGNVAFNNTRGPSLFSAKRITS